MAQKFVIGERMPGLNDYLAAMNSHRHEGNRMKQLWTDIVCIAAKQAKLIPIDKRDCPVWIVYRFYELDRRRDKDNVSGFAHKVIQDGLVRAGILLNDNWNYIDGYEDHFDTTAEQPRIEVEIWKKGEKQNAE